MEVIPALDLRGGNCVRLHQGDYALETIFTTDPLEIADQWSKENIPRMHIVDLDGARSGDLANLEVLKTIAALDTPIQVGGGIRDVSTAYEMINLGVDRIVIGSRAVQDGDFVQAVCKELGPDHVVVALDAKDGYVHINGWQEKTDVLALDLMSEMSANGVRRFLYTDISRDGTMTEPNFVAIKDLFQHSTCCIQASGGVAEIEHIIALSKIGVEGVIIGSALLRRSMTIKEALEAAG